MRATLGRLFAVGLIVVAVTGCDVVGTTSYDYSNPLDPREDTAISALLPYVVRIDDGFRMVSAARDNDAFIVAERDMPVAAAEDE